MAEVYIAIGSDMDAKFEMDIFLRKLGAKEADEQPGIKLEYFLTDIIWTNFVLPSGEMLVSHFDGFVGSSIGGEEEVVGPIAASFLESQTND